MVAASLSLRVFQMRVLSAATVTAIFDILKFNDGDAGLTYSTKQGYPFETYGGDPVAGDLVPVPVPLPASAALLLGAFAGLAALRRRARTQG
jgi:hypothetical protein